MISIERDAWKYCYRLPFDFLEAFFIDRRRFSPEAEDTESYYLIYLSLMDDYVFYVPVSFFRAVSLSVYPSSFDLLVFFLPLQHFGALPLIICH